MSPVKATPPPGALTRKEARDRGLVEFLSQAICRRVGCNTFTREVRTLQCVACREKDAPKEAAKAEKARALARAKTASDRARAAAARKRQAAKALKDSQKDAARKTRSDARELARRQAAAAKAKATREANRARAQEGPQEPALALNAAALHLPPWEDAEVSPGAAQWDADDGAAAGDPFEVEEDALPW